MEDQNINQLRIKDFLQKQVGRRLKDFCSYHRMNVETQTGESGRTDLDFEGLSGSTFIEKSVSLVKEMQGKGWLPNLVFYLTNWWLYEYHGGDDLFLKAKMHEELCTAAQELWRKEEHRSQAIQAFDRLATLQKEDFAQEWAKTKEVLAHAPSLGPIKDIDRLVTHLAKCRELYEQTIEHRKNHQWLEARTAFRKLEKFQPGYHDVPDWVKCLGNLKEVRRLQKVIDVAERGFFYDDRLPWEGDYPYRLFQQKDASISPSSAMVELQDALLQLNLQKPESASLESLLQVDQRLLVDTFLYPLCPSKETACQLEALFLEKNKGRLPGPDVISKKFPKEAEMILLLLGQPEETSARWTEQQQGRPRSGQLAHCQALLYLGQAYDADAQDLETVVKNWQRAISHWAVAMADTLHWKDWGNERNQRYAKPVLDTHIKNLGIRVRDHLGDLLRKKGERSAEAGQTEWVEAFDKLYQELFAEFTAVRLAKELGGITIEQGRRAWFGPLWMTFFEMEEALAEHMKTVGQSSSLAGRLSDDVALQDKLRQLRWYFSYLRPAAVLLAGPNPDPEQALKAMNNSEYALSPPCDDPYCPQHGSSPFPVMVCCPHAEQLAEYNPAYANLANPQAQMCEDALYLAIEAHLRLAQAQIDQGKIKDRQTLQAEWQIALKLVEAYDQDPPDVQAIIRVSVLDATVLSIRTREMGDLDEAIALLDLYQSTLSDDDRSVKTGLAKLLAIRGEVKERQPDWSGAEEDFRRALAITPHDFNIRQNLAILWLNQVNKVAHKNRFLALDLLRRVEESIQEGMQKYPGFNYDMILNNIKKARRSFSRAEDSLPDDEEDVFEKLVGMVSIAPSDVAQLYSQGIQHISAGQFQAALDTLSQAMEVNPGDPVLQKAVAKAVVNMAWQLIDEGDHDAGLELVEKEWMPKLPTQEQLPRQLEFFRWWPTLRFFLKGIDQYATVKDSQEVLLPFEAPNIDTPLLSLRVEDDNLCLTAPLPPFLSKQAETILGNLLRVSREMMVFKVSASSKTGLSLRGVVPFRLLNVKRFARLCFGVFKYVDIPPEKLTRFDELQVWFQEKRASYVQGIAASKDDLPTVASDVLEALCQKRDDLEERRLPQRYRVETKIGRVDMDTWAEAVRISTRLGMLRKKNDFLEMFRQLAESNTTIKLGKLALIEDQRTVMLSVELPHVDEQSMGEIFDFLMKKSSELQSKLASTILG